MWKKYGVENKNRNKNMTYFICRSLRGDKLLFAVTRLGRSSLWSVGGSALGVSRPSTKMGLRRHCMPTCRLSGSYTMGSIGVHFHVDLRRPLSGYQVKR